MQSIWLSFKRQLLFLIKYYLGFSARFTISKYVVWTDWMMTFSTGSVFSGLMIYSMWSSDTLCTFMVVSCSDATIPANVQIDYCNSFQKPSFQKVNFHVPYNKCFHQVPSIIKSFRVANITVNCKHWLSSQI